MKLSKKAVNSNKDVVKVPKSVENPNQSPILKHLWGEGRLFLKASSAY